MKPVLEVRNLTVTLKTKKERTVLVDDVSFTVGQGQCLGILGESGSGKSMTMKAILGLLGRQFEVTGSAIFAGQDLLKMPDESLRQLRGKDIAMILQNPMTCFDPLERIGKQMAEGLLEHKICLKQEAMARCTRILEQMQIHAPREALKKYPHQLSGGMLQRIMIGLALAGEPKLLIADEPTTAIDAITQHEIMERLLHMRQASRCGMVFISHDLGVIARMSDAVAVMHDTRLVQSGSMREIIRNPVSAYTRELISNKMALMRRFQEALQGKAGNGC